MLGRLFPRKVDEGFAGQRAAVWLLGLLVALKLVMSANSVLNTAAVAGGADAIPLDRFGDEAAREVLLLFALMAYAQLVLAALALIVLVRYRALVPLVYLALLAEQLGRRLIVQSHDVARGEAGSFGWSLRLAILALLALGLALSLLPARGRRDSRSD